MLDFCRGHRYAEGCGFRFPTFLDFVDTRITDRRDSRKDARIIHLFSILFLEGGILKYHIARVKRINGGSLFIIRSPFPLIIQFPTSIKSLNFHSPVSSTVSSTDVPQFPG